MLLQSQENSLQELRDKVKVQASLLTMQSQRIQDLEETTKAAEDLVVEWKKHAQVREAIVVDRAAVSLRESNLCNIVVDPLTYELAATRHNAWFGRWYRRRRRRPLHSHKPRGCRRGSLSALLR